VTKTVLIIGADGSIGHALMRACCAQGYAVAGTSRRRNSGDSIFLDLAAPDAGGTHLPPADIAVFCAAISGFRACREDPELARRVNVTVPAALAAALVARGTRVIALSSSSVFDWSTPRVPAGTAPCPTSLYGRLKAECEAAFLDLGDAATIVRFAKVLAPGMPLITGWIEALRDGRQITAFSDLRMAPVALDDAVALLVALIDGTTSGIYQYSARADISYAEAAGHVAAALGAPRSAIVAASARDAGIPPEEITFFSSLESSRAEELLGRSAPDPFDTLDEVFSLPSRIPHARTADCRA